jgi:hypothetical protein
MPDLGLNISWMPVKKKNYIFYSTGNLFQLCLTFKISESRELNIGQSEYKDILRGSKWRGEHNWKVHLLTSFISYCFANSDRSEKKQLFWRKCFVCRGSHCPLRIQSHTSHHSSKIVSIVPSWVEFILLPTVSRPVRPGIGLPFGAHDQIYISLLFFFWLTITFILFPMASSLTRGRVCSLECLHSLVRSLTTNNHKLPSHLRLCSLFVASYDSQGLRWRYSNPPPHGSIKTKFLLSHI